MALKRRVAEGKDRGRPRRTTVKRQAEDNDQVPEVFQEMLAEIAQNPSVVQTSQNKTIKRRRLDEGTSQTTAVAPNAEDASMSLDDMPSGPETGPKAMTSSEQFVIDDLEASSDDEEGDFEDVDLEADAGDSIQHKIADQTLDLDLSRIPRDDASATMRRRKPATAMERRMRLDVHKWHVLCLLAHLRQRNSWCEDDQAQASLKALVPRKIIKLLHLDASQAQYQRNHSFNCALDEISKIWRAEWKITEQGMRRSYWKEKPDDLQDTEDFPDPVDLQDFRDAAEARSGSRDLGAQLFCSLLRSVAVDTRLVFSLQPLPLSGVARGVVAEKAKPQYITATSLGRQPRWNPPDEASAFSNPRWRAMTPEPGQESILSSKKTRRSIKDSPYPIYWVEVFNEAIQKWIPLDPLVRKTVNKPRTGFEPPASDPLNKMSYVVAFEDDGSARDVTRRYVQAYNGKTRRNRVESTRGGQQWWERTMFLLEKAFPEDRDAIEDAELLVREQGEQMPRNVQDFKNHPYYVLERHLKRNEVIYPKREVGKVSVGQTRDAKLEAVFRRKDLLVVRSADQWYRRGRAVKTGEQPRKELILRSRINASRTGEEYNSDEGDKAMLYAESQTQVYLPPNVNDGRVPRNAYGNLDVYVPSMIPAGGIHVQHPDAVRAAKVLGVDYVDAVTGFSFKGRQGTAVLSGIVAAAKYRGALVEVLQGIEYERACEHSQRRTAMALQMWKKFLTALRIREDVNVKYGDGGGQAGDAGDAGDESDDVLDETHREAEYDSDEGGGGFFPEPMERPEVAPPAAENEFANINDFFDPPSTVAVEVPIIIHESPHRTIQQEIVATAERKRITEDTPQRAQLQVGIQRGGGGGGFLLDDGEEGGGGEEGGFLINDPSISINHEAESAVKREVSPSTTTHSHQRHAPPTPPHPPSSSFATIGNLSKKAETAEAATSHHIPQNSTATANTPDPPGPSESRTPDIDINDDDAETSSSLDRGSLLSHDPEDDDAEPEWLEGVMVDSE